MDAHYQPNACRSPPLSRYQFARHRKESSVTRDSGSEHNDFDYDLHTNAYGKFHPIIASPPNSNPPSVSRENTPQIGYFVPLDTVCFLTPSPKKRNSSINLTPRSRRSTSYGGGSSLTPTPTQSSSHRSSTETLSNLMLDSPRPLLSHMNQKHGTCTNGNIPGNLLATATSTLLNGYAKPFLRTPTSNRKMERYSECYINPYLTDENYMFINQKRLKKKNRAADRNFYSMNETIEVLADQVIESDPLGERTSWEYHTVIVTRVPGYGFGIAVSGGRDNPHFANGDPSIAVSDVLKGGPAEDRLQVNDRIITVNGVSLENVEYATAVQVLRDSGNTVNLVIKRRVPNLNMITPNHQHSHSFNSSGLGMGGTTTPQQTIKLVLTKSNKKDDFGIVFGCRLFVKEISSKAREQLALNGFTLQEGDIVNRIHNTNCNDSMSLKEAKKIIEGCKEKLNLVVLREISQANNNLPNVNNSNGMTSPVYSHTAQVSNCSNIDETFLPGGASYSTQNLYVQPPTRPSTNNSLDDKSNLTPRGRSRNPLMDVSLTQLDRPSTPQTNHNRSRSGVDEPPRPPPPRGEDFYASRRQLYDDDPLQRTKQSAEPRYISFQKEGSVGIRLTGGNEVGIFVTAVQPGSPASLQGLTPGDKILKVNDMDMHGVTREEAVLFLLSLQDRIDLIVQHCKEEYDNVVANQRGDSFHIKTHFHYENPSKGELSFKAGDVFRVIDTLHNGVVGSWQVLRIGRGHEEMQRGVIPNKSRAEELATAQFNASKKEMNASESRGNFFRRRRSSHRRSKSLSRENWDDVVFSDSISKFPAYERVVLRHPGFVRPVVLFGPTADIAREKLIKDFPDKFTAPLQDENKSSKSGIVRLSNIRDIMDRGKHALLDITPNAVDRLNYAQFYPIVIFLKADSKHTIKQLRHGIPKSAHKSSKKLLEQCQKLDRIWSHVFSTTIILNDVDTWYRKLRDSIDLQQSGAVWMSETKPVESLSDDFLFPMTTSRLSYASSPESDLELSPGPSASLSLGNLPQLVKSSSDPSIATNQDNLDRDLELNIGEGMPPPYMHSYDNPNNARRPPAEGKYGFSSTNNQNVANGGASGPNASQIDPSQPTYSTTTRQPSFGGSGGNNQSIYGTAPDLPPRVDRASKPPGLTTNIAQKLNLSKSSNSSGGTINRTIHERLFSSKKVENIDQDEYGMRSQFEKKNDNQDPPSSRENTLKTNNGSYDSVSSYDSYNAAAQNIRLGPNAPDDLKSVPNTNGRLPVTVGNLNVLPASERSGGDGGHAHSDSLITNRSSLHEHSRSLSNGANDLNRQSSPGRPPFPIDRGLSQRPTSLGLETTPKKLMMDTKTDYGKYSRNNSASQADYKTPPPTNSGMVSQNGTPFKPVPPPKPKNYRPPVQGGNMGPPSGHWDGDEPKSPRSPNSFFYPTSPPHYHHTGHNSSPSTAGHHPNGPPMHPYNHQYAGNGNYNSPQNSFNNRESQMGNNGYNGNHMYAGQQYMYRNSGMNNIPHHPSERHALDLAGSREQRGSAFELYRKPQIGGLVGHQHNLRLMDGGQPSSSSPSPYHHPAYYSQSSSSPSPLRSNDMNEHRQYACENNLPPLLPKKKSKLKSPLTAIKNAFIRSTRPLRRQSSMVEAEQKKAKPSILKRQYSLMENRNRVRYYDDESYTYHTRHEPFYPREYDDYRNQNYEHEPIYGYHRDYQREYESENLYANRALIELERNQGPPTRNPPQYGGKIVRRHSLAERTSSYQNRYYNQVPVDDITIEPIYQTRSGSYMMQERKQHVVPGNYHNNNNNNMNYDTVPNRRLMHLDHIYQSKSEMLEKINMSRKDVVSRNENEYPKTESPSKINDTVFRNQSQLREHIYQTRQETMKSMAEPIYMSKREFKNEPIYEVKEDNLSKDHQDTVDHQHHHHNDDELNVADENKNNKENSLMLEEILNTLNKEPYNCELTLSDEQSGADNQNTVIEKKTESISPDQCTIKNINNNDGDTNISSCPKSPIGRTPHHLSHIIKRTTPMHAIGESQTSIETHYNSQASLIPLGKPNAQSTPYASEMSIGTKMGRPLAPPREPTTTRGTFNVTGGTLSDPIWNVSLVIPEGAIPKGLEQEIYFTVTDPRLSEHVGGPPLDMQNGEQMLSPLVMCGPQGLEFLTPVTLNIPHCAASTLSFGLSLKATDSEKNLQTNWEDIEIPRNPAAHVVSVKVDHF